MSATIEHDLEKAESKSVASAASTAGRRTRGSTLRAALREARRDPVTTFTAVVPIVVLAITLLAAFWPGLLATGDPLHGEITQKFLPPSAEHWFGTDALGRDLYTRVVHGAQLTLRAVLVAVLIAFGVGSLLGLVAGYIGGIVDDVIMRIVDVLLAVPSLLLSLAVVTALGSGVLQVSIAVGVGSVASFARITRTEVLRVKAIDFVEAAAGSGLGRSAVLFRHVLPNAAGPAVVLSTLELGTAVLAVASLSFLGFGAPPPEPEWGRLISEGRNYLSTSWWLVGIPSLVVVAVILSTNGLARTIDRRVRHVGS